MLRLLLWLSNYTYSVVGILISSLANLGNYVVRQGFSTFCDGKVNLKNWLKFEVCDGFDTLKLLQIWVQLKVSHQCLSDRVKST